MPGYHLPNSKDGDAKNSRETSSPFSFHCSGDFTSSGHEEFALILLGQDQLRVAIFAPNAGGPYRLIYLARPKIAEEWGEYAEGSLVQHAEQIEMRTIPKGESWAPESGDVFENFHAPRDAIDLHTHPKPNYDFASLLLHENGEFQQLNSQPLIRLQ
ncbi:MAG TPA: hypothetical protein VLX32_10460 [Candidatus Acidoferrum sp.]|nr:hypothetical protein [Candidatus Acidoferrum sp.]